MVKETERVAISDEVRKQPLEKINKSINTHIYNILNRYILKIKAKSVNSSEKMF